MKKLTKRNLSTKEDLLNTDNLIANTRLKVIYEDKVENDGDSEMIVNKMRVHFFFTEEGGDKHFWKFLSNTEVEIRLTDGPYWEG